MTTNAEQNAAALAEELGRTNQVTVEWRTTVTTSYQHTVIAAELAGTLGITSAELFRRMASQDLTVGDAEDQALDGFLIDLEQAGPMHDHPSTDDRKVMVLRRAKDGDIPDGLGLAGWRKLQEAADEADRLRAELHERDQRIASMKETLGWLQNEWAEALSDSRDGAVADPTIYAVPGDGRTPADRWMWQTGNVWMAVAPEESEDEWFADVPPEFDVPARRVLPIAERPASGTLVWCDASGREITAYANGATGAAGDAR